MCTKLQFAILRFEAARARLCHATYLGWEAIQGLPANPREAAVAYAAFVAEAWQEEVAKNEGRAPNPALPEVNVLGDWYGKGDGPSPTLRHLSCTGRTEILVVLDEEAPECCLKRHTPGGGWGYNAPYVPERDGDPVVVSLMGGGTRVGYAGLAWLCERFGLTRAELEEAPFEKEWEDDLGRYHFHLDEVETMRQLRAGTHPHMKLLEEPWGDAIVQLSDGEIGYRLVYPDPESDLRPVSDEELVALLTPRHEGGEYLKMMGLA